MVQAIINVGDDTNRVLNIVKAQFGLKDKSEAIEVMAQRYEQEILEPALRSEYIEKLNKIEKQKGIKFKSMAELRRIIEDKA
ncbi:DUF2683 family protein [Candidatus Woesearchaeota archaeon]|nr:DUF2683 family protein [Candidatus Woesearchaeota archaeon]